MMTTHSLTAKRYPMQPRMPALNVSVLPHIPGILSISFGGDSHLSGLNASGVVSVGYGRRPPHRT